MSTKRFGIFINNLIDLSYMTTYRSPVGQSKEEYKDQESMHDAAWHCPEKCLGFKLKYRGSANVNFDC